MIKAVITDIEGTTSALAFVQDVLFPYARVRLPEFVAKNKHQPAVAVLLNDVRALASTMTLNKDWLTDTAVVEVLLSWIDSDKKITPLKALQGMIWEAGFRAGDFQGHIYEDAVRNLRKWQGQGVKLYVYSSGSIHAQQLLFSHTAFGDLTPLFSGYFDTTIGAKKDAHSYQAIAQKIAITPEALLFLSDIEAELDAARAAGMHTAWLVRAGQCSASAVHRQVTDFDALDLVS